MNTTTAEPALYRTAGALEVREVEVDEYRSFLAGATRVSYQQTPEWAEVRRAQWSSELIGWFTPLGDLRGVAAVRYRTIPGIGSRFAFLPQGPVLEWERSGLGDALDALTEFLARRKVFALRMSPPLELRHWEAESVRRALADHSLSVLSEVRPDGVDATGERVVEILRAHGWRRVADDADFENSQPRHSFHLPLADLTEEGVLAGMTKSWRKGVRRAERDGVFVRNAGADDLLDVHRLHVETAERQGFPPHPMSFFDAVWREFSPGRSGSFHLHLGCHERDVLSADAMVVLGGRAQGLFAANGAAKRNLGASNAVYWARIREAIREGAAEFDFGGVSPVVDPAHPEAGLLSFKVGLGGRVVEEVGPWDLVLRPRTHRAFVSLLPAYRALSEGWASLGARHARRGGRSVTPVHAEPEGESGQQSQKVFAPRG